MEGKPVEGKPVEGKPVEGSTLAKFSVTRPMGHDELWGDTGDGLTFVLQGDIRCCLEVQY